MKKIILLFILSVNFLFAQETAPANWFNLDPETDKVMGVSTEKTYKELLAGKNSTTVIVGVIDSGVDYKHEDLKDVMWVNTLEIAGNGIDDDKNGYIDDIHGWNFIGGKDGKNVEKETLEVTRLYSIYKKKFDGKTETSILPNQKKDFQTYLDLKDRYEKRVAEANDQMGQINFFKSMIENLISEVKKQLNVEKVDYDALEKFETKDAKMNQSKAIFKNALKSNGGTMDDMMKEILSGEEKIKDMLEYNLNTEFDPRPIVGDNYEDAFEKYYGNNDCMGPSSLHGTHVAGIIAANRNNEIGMKGVADNVRIMSIRAVPDGDERDKDIANAIIYAVDNGAQIINMSFGKSHSFNKNAVDNAVKYAESKDVLIIHAAGNDALDIDKNTHFPCKTFENSKKQAKNWLDVGALSWKSEKNSPAPFSNYGKKTVDVFAPGVDIYSTENGGGYVNLSGTSMACPVTAGVAALIKSYFPNLSAKQIKEILKESTRTDLKGKKVFLPGSKEEILFSELSNTGGVINAYNAVLLAMKKSKKTRKIRAKF